MAHKSNIYSLYGDNVAHLAEVIHVVTELLILKLSAVVRTNLLCCNRFQSKILYLPSGASVSGWSTLRRLLVASLLQQGRASARAADGSCQ